MSSSESIKAVEFRPFVCIPCYNHSDSLKQLLPAVLRLGLPVILVDDGSNPPLSPEIASFGSVQLLRHESNRGKGAALLTAIEQAKSQRATHLICMDADGQHFAEDLPKFIAAIRRNPKALIIGERDFGAADSGDISFASRFGRRFSDFWVATETGRRVFDTQSGFRSYPLQHPAMELVLPRLKARAYDFEIEILVQSIRAGIPLEGIGIRVHYPQRDLRISHFHKIRDNWRLTCVHTRLCASGLLRLVGLGRRPSQALLSRYARANDRSGAWVMPLALRILGRPVTIILAIFPVLYFFGTDPRGRRGLKEMHRLTGSRMPTCASFMNYLNFAVLLFDRILLLKTKKLESLYSRTPPIGFEDGIILVGSHHGDWLRCAVGIRLKYMNSNRLAMVLDLKASPNFANYLRGDPNLEIIDTGRGVEVAFQIRDHLEKGGHLCFLADRRLKAVRGRGKNFKLPFLGEEALFPSIPFDLAKIFGKRLVAFTSTRRGGIFSQDYEVNIEDLWDGRSEASAQELAERYVHFLERQVKAKPSQWFNFFPFWRTEEA